MKINAELGSAYVRDMFGNWRWWLVLPIALCLAPFGMIEWIAGKIDRLARPLFAWVYRYRS